MTSLPNQRPSLSSRSNKCSASFLNGRVAHLHLDQHVNRSMPFPRRLPPVDDPQGRFDVRDLVDHARLFSDSDRFSPAVLHGGEMGRGSEASR